MNNWNENNSVSIITPAYNCATYIHETIESVLYQTYTYWEMIIVDDYSSDDTVNIIKKYQEQDKRIHLIQLQQNQGVAFARNTGIKYSRGRYIAFLDSDDIWLYNKIERQLEFMKNNNVAFSYTQYRQFMKNPEQCGKIINVPKVVDYKSLLKGNVIGCLTVMIDRQVIPDFSMPKERHEDYITWLSILKQGHNAYGLNEDLARYRISANSISANKKRSALWTWNIYRNIENLSILESLYYFSHYLASAMIKHYLK